jgi:2-polyprenyl-3-methyl-5-hydroxy-6-metoxy-1,4-benzoquinol methylase
MTCGQCQGIEILFDEKSAMKELKAYLKKGPSKPTQLLIDVLNDQGVENSTLLDIGGGVGAIQFELLEDGVSHTTGVDASSGYLTTIKKEAKTRDLEEKMSFQHGNFVDIAPTLTPADIVTLDKVLCCYHDMTALVSSSVGLAKKYYGVVFPQDNIFSKTFLRILNIFMWLGRNPYRSFVHPTEEVEKIIFENGFKRFSYQRKSIWQVIVYAK